MTPNKFQHAGLDWIPHTPGEPMPCPPDTKVRVLLKARGLMSESKAKRWHWEDLGDGSIIGWHPIEEQPSLARRIHGQWEEEA